MPVVEVPCPGCGARLKAPENKIGKKAKCGKCGNTFRIPGGAPVGPTPALGDLAAPEELDEVPMATAVEEPVPPAAPAKGLSSLPSADPFAFGKPAAKPAPAPTPAPAATAKPAFGSAKAPSGKLPPAAPKPAAPVASTPTPAPTAPKPAAPVAAKPAPPPAAKPAAPAPEALSLDDAEPLPLDDLPVATPAPIPAPVPAPAPSTVAPEKTARAKKPEKNEPRGEEPKSKKKAKREEPPPTPAPAAAAPSSDNPFAFTSAPAEPERPAKAKRRDEDEPRKKRRDDQDEEEPIPRYQRQQGGTAKTLLITGAVGFLALAMAAAAAVVYVVKNREPAKTEEKKKEEPPPAEPPKTEPPKVEPKPDPKGEPKVEPKMEPKPPDPLPVSKLPMLALPKLRTFATSALPAELKLADRPKGGTVLDSTLASVRRVFPPFDLRTGDTHVLVQLDAAAGGKGTKLALDTYSASSGKRSGRIEFDGDAQPVPLCDLHATANGVRFLAATDGKLSVWNVVENQKEIDGLDPYAGKPAHQKAGLAAAFFAPDPNQVVTISTAGAVHLFDLKTKTVTDEFVPPNGVPGRVALGKSVAAAEGGGSVVLAVGGVLYQVKSAPGLDVLRKHELGGEVGRSLGVAASGTPGRILYAFETDADKKKEKAVLGLPLGTAARPVVLRWPDSAGEPKGAVWAGGSMGGVITPRGIVWFDDDEGRFAPLVLAEPANKVPSLHFGDDRGHWYVLPHPKVPAQSVLVALSVPFDDFVEFRSNFETGKPLRTVRIDHEGLSK